MSLSSLAKPHNLLTRLIITLALFLAAFYIDFRFEASILYPIYLIAILYASINVAFFVGIPLAAIASYLSIHSISIDSASFITILFRFAVLYIISFLFSAYIDLTKTYRLRFELLKSMIPQCPDCGAIFCQDGRWRNLQEISAKPDLLGELPIHNCETNSKFIPRD